MYKAYKQTIEPLNDELSVMLRTGNAHPLKCDHDKAVVEMCCKEWSRDCLCQGLPIVYCPDCAELTNQDTEDILERNRHD